MLRKVALLLSRFLPSPGPAVSGQCRQCGTCCRNLILVHKGQPVETLDQFNALKRRQRFYRRFQPVYRDKEDGFLYFTCEKLAEDNVCEDYGRRPAICRAYPNPGMLRFGGKLLNGCGYRIEGQPSFRSAFHEALEKTQ